MKKYVLMGMFAAILALGFAYCAVGDEDGDGNGGPCVPNVEICDGVDNDCDGYIDENATAEQCNGEDDDCDNLIDEQIADRSCDSACGPGTESCQGGVWTTCNAPQPQEEVCDGQDNDCDGQTDEGCACTEGQQQQCGSGTGECEKGLQTCTNGTWGDCVGEVGPTTEECNSKDDDCDGQVDEELARDCSTTCGPGEEACVGGQYQSCTAPQPEAEVCDGRDNDCNGTVDDGLIADPYDQMASNETCSAASNLGQVVEDHPPADPHPPSVFDSPTIYPVGDIDWYKFTAAESTAFDICTPLETEGCYEVTVSLSNIPAGQDYDLCVQSPDCGGTPSCSESGGNADERLSLRYEGICGLNDDLDFLVKVFPYPAGSGGDCLSYTLTMGVVMINSGKCPTP